MLVGMKKDLRQSEADAGDVSRQFVSVEEANQFVKDYGKTCVFNN